MGKPKKLRRLIKAVKMGKPYALYRLGLLYYEGKMVAENVETAVTLIEAAGIAGYQPAIEWMEDYKFDDDALTQAYS